VAKPQPSLTVTYMSDDGRQVMFAEREHFNVLYDHHFVVIFVEDGIIEQVYKGEYDKLIVLRCNDGESPLLRVSTVLHCDHGARPPCDQVTNVASDVAMLPFSPSHALRLGCKPPDFSLCECINGRS